ncbi:MAG: hypothetical protein F2563_04380 [Actinobacteria bacterium]|uniref:Unannotated protein n=1 Tax=freshwater metagenome TaxID=449393 RepID=A0A6J6F5D2_9ZZZZ|nr:hypothetical protein [Actinomycetota bacterium]
MKTRKRSMLRQSGSATRKLSQSKENSDKKNNTKNSKSRFDKIVNFMKKSKKEKIQKELLNLIQNREYCPILLGDGSAGTAYLPGIDKTFPYKIGNKIVHLPVVVKEVQTHHGEPLNDYDFGLDILDSKLYISGYTGLTTEALLLMLIDNLRNKTVHLPLLFAFGTCSNSKLDKLVDRLYTLKYGLDKPVELDLTRKVYNEDSLWNEGDDVPNLIFKNTLATLGRLLSFIHYSKNEDDTITLPNGIKCNISELYDYICISFFATHYLLTKNNIFPSDMHTENIFIHWLNETSYFNDKNIKNVEEIVYKIGNKYYKIKTFGFVIVLGDIGTFIAKIKKDVILIGHAPNIKTTFSQFNMRMKKQSKNMELIYNTVHSLTPRQYKNTIAYTILMNIEPYCTTPTTSYGLLGSDIAYLENMRTTPELLDFFYDKYGVRNYDQKNNNILITDD